MNITENKLNESEIELVFELDRADLESDLRVSAKRISENIEIAGFRKGNAPYDVVCRHIGGEAKVYEEALQKIVGKALFKATQDKKLEAVGRPEISIQKMVPPFGISFKAKLSLPPSVELGDVSKIKINRKDVKVESEDVEKIINNLLQMRATESSVSRAIRKSDKAILDLEVKRAGVLIENGKSSDYPLVIGEGRFIPGFEEQLIGLKQGDKKSFELEFPKEYHDKSLAGKKAWFDVNVKQVFERNLPEFNDKFAKQLGDYKSAEDLRSKIAENLRHEREREEQERYQMSAMQELVKISKIGQMSESMISEESDRMVRELEHDVSGQAIKFEDYLKSIKKSRQDLAKEFRARAQERLRLMLVAREFGRKENVKIDEKDVEQEVEISKKAYKNAPEAVARFESKDYKNYVKNALTSRRIFEKLAEKIEKG